jgi:hypothetical protein
MTVVKNNAWKEIDKSLVANPPAIATLRDYFGKSRKLVVTKQQVYITDTSYGKLEDIFDGKIRFPFVQVNEYLIINMQHFKVTSGDRFVECNLDSELYNVLLKTDKVVDNYDKVDMYCTLSKSLFPREVSPDYIQQFSEFRRKYRI